MHAAAPRGASHNDSDGTVPLSARAALAQVVAVACLMLAADAPLSEAQAWTQRLPGTDPEAVCLAIEELLQAYERPALTTRACHIALAADT